MAARKLEVVFVGDSSQLERTFKRVGAGSDGLAGKFEKTGRKMQSIGAGMSKAFTLPLAGIGLASAKLAIDFDKTFTEIEGLVGVNRKTLGKWRTEILAMSKELPQSPKELAEALYFVASSGLKGEEAMKALRASAKGAAAGLGETQDVADAVTSALNAYGTKNLSASKAVDVMTGAVREGKAEAADLAPVFGRVVPAAQAMGVSFDQVGAGLASLTLTGNDAEESATQMGAIFSTFMKGTGPTRAALKQMHLSIDDVRKSIREKGLEATLVDLRKQTKKYGVDVAQLFPNIRALRGFLSLTGENAGKVQTIFKKLSKETGSTDRAFEVASKGGMFRLKSALSSVQVAGIELGEALLPVVVPMIEDLASAAGWAAEKFAALPGPVQKVIVIGGGLLAVVGPLVAALGFLSMGIGAAIPVITAIGGAIATAATAVAGFAVAFAVPIAVVAALAAGAYLLWKNWDAVSGWLSARWGDLAGVATGAFGAVKGVVVGTWNAIKGVTVAVWNAIAGVLRGIWSAIGPVVKLWFTFYKEFITSVWNVIKLATTSLWNVIAGFLKKVWGAIRSAAVAIFTPIRTFITGVWNALSSATHAVWNSVAGWLGAKWGAIRSTASHVWHAVSDAITGPIQSGTRWVRDRVEWLRDRVAGVWKDMVGGVKDFGGRVKDGVVGAFKGVVAQVLKFAIKILDVVGRIPGVDFSKTTKGLKKQGKDWGLPGFARGGAMGASTMASGGSGGRVTRPLAIVGEEAPRHEEYVIPTNPAYRGRALGLFSALGSKLGLPMFAEGGVFGYDQLKSLWVKAGGGGGETADIAAAIALAESGGRSGIRNSIGAAGLWQIFGLPFSGNPLDPFTNARMAVAKWRAAGGFSPWTTYTGADTPNHEKTYLRYLHGGGGGGGILGFLGGLAGDALKLATKGPKWLIDQLPSPSDYLPDWLVGMGKKAIGGVGGWIKDKVAGLFGGMPSGTLGDMPANLRGLMAQAQTMGLAITSTTGGKHAPGSYHYLGRAFDASNGSGPTSQMMAFAKRMVTLYGSKLAELFYDPLGYSIKNGQKVGWTPGGHSNHVHVAMARGGRVRVGELGPEDVYLPHGSYVQPASKTRDDGGDGPLIGQVNINHGADEREIARQLAWLVD